MPIVTTPSDNLLTNNAAPTFSGTAEPFAHVPVFDGSTQIGNPQASVDGSWAFTPASGLDDGTHLWRVRAVDAAGNRSDYTPLRTLKIDTQAPEAPVIVNPAAAAQVATRTPTFSGSAEAQATISVYEGAEQLCSISADSGGSWSCVSNVELPDGPHQVDVIARDGAGNESVAAQRSFELDATAPDPPIVTLPIDGFATTATSLTVFGTAAPDASIKILIGSEEVVNATAGNDGNWSHMFSNLAEGDYALAAKEIDSFGNRSVLSNVANVRVDRTAPTVTVDTHPPLRTNQTSAAFTLAASEPNVELECALDGSGWTPCSDAPSYDALSASTHSFKARATDGAGNLGDESTLFTWTIDLELPAAPVIDSPMDGATVTTDRPTFTGVAEESASVELFVGATPRGTATADESTGAWELTPESALGQGELVVKARATDEAGNIGEFGATQTLTVDSIAPTGQSSEIAGSAGSDGVPTFLIASDDSGATAQCKLDNGSFVSCSGHYKPAASAGAHALTVRFTDAAGNASDQVLVFSVVPSATTPPADGSPEPTLPLPKFCKVLGTNGLTSGRLKIVAATGTGREMKLSLRSSSAAVVRVDAVAGTTTLAAAPFALKSGTTKLRVKLRRAPASGTAVALAVRFYSVKREYGTARLALVADSSGLRRAPGAKSTLGSECPTVGGARVGVKFKAMRAAAGARSFTLTSQAKRPGLIAFRVHRAGVAAPVADQIVAVGAGKQKLKIKLLGSARLAAGGYKFTFDAMSAGGRTSSGRGAFIAR